MRILLLEDDQSLSRGISLKLQKEGFSVTAAASLAQAGECLQQPYSLAILDLNLPDGSGLDLCRQLRRQQPGIYILLLTALDTEADMVIGYELGADDYVTKPFSLSVLLSKIQAFQRRSSALMLDSVRHTALLGADSVSLTKNESRLLATFMENPGQTLSRGQLLHALWDIDSNFVDDNTLAVNIQRLRAKIEKDPKNPTRILTVRGLGYRYIENA